MKVVYNILMANDFKDYKIKIKHPVLQGIAFILFLVIAIGAITYGITSIGTKTSGFYFITPNDDEEAAFYSQGFDLVYGFSGTSSEIKSQTKEVTACYSTALCRAYKLTDKENTYSGYNNIAYINDHQGEWVEVNDELFEILKDAYTKTLNDPSVYNMFAGAFYDHWVSILSLSNPEDFDPLNNQEEAERLKALTEKTEDLSNFTLEFDEASSKVFFDISEEYGNFIRDAEESDDVLDLNLMADSYISEIAVEALEDAGYTNGYLQTESGITVALSGYGDGRYAVYGIEDGKTVEKESFKAEPGTCMSVIYRFALSDSDDLYYAIEKDGKTVYRSYESTPSDDGTFVYTGGSFYSLGENEDISETAYKNLLNMAGQGQS